MEQFMSKGMIADYAIHNKDFVRAVRYMNANGIKAADRERIAAESQQLLDEQAQYRTKLAAQHIDPELIDRVRYCVDTVIKAGEEPKQRESIRAQLKIHQSMCKSVTKDDVLIERKEAPQLL